MIRIYVNKNSDVIRIHDMLNKSVSIFRFKELSNHPEKLIEELINTIASHPKPGDDMGVELRVINEDSDTQIGEW